MSGDTGDLDRLRDAARRRDFAAAEVRALAMVARDNGRQVTEIAGAAGVTRPTVYKWIREDRA